MTRFIKSLLFILLFIAPCTGIFSQGKGEINPDLLSKPWQATWISHPNISGDEYGVYLFQKSFVLDSDVDQFIIHVSADNRYKLYVNGKSVCNGPARGYFMKWNFETVDISPWLKKGRNIISAVVWNFTEFRPVAQFSHKTGFILQGNTEAESIINTNTSWLVFNDTAYTPLPVHLPHYYVVGPGEKFNGKHHPWNWMDPGYNDTAWEQAEETMTGTPLLSRTDYGETAMYTLTPRAIPMMEEITQRFGSVRRSDLPAIPDHFLAGEEPLTIPANSTIKLLLDQNHLTNAYPVLVTSGGEGSVIKLTYAESLIDTKNLKGNRNDIEGKKITGNQDIIIPDGGEDRTFQTLWWRTFRYVEMEIEMKDDPLVINDFHSMFTGYPFQEKATFRCDDPLFTDIWDVGWRTQRLCAGETFFDCPYYEQLQYVGDTRIQSLVSTYVSGDTLMMRNAIASLNDSRLPFGLTQSRYPSYDMQIIPPFSLVWVTMVYDYWMLCRDEEFVKSMIPGIVGVLQWYESKIDSTGMLGRMEHWNFVDWVESKNWARGTPPGIDSSHSAIINLQYVYTLQKASALMNGLNRKEQSRYYTNLANMVKSIVYKSCYDDGRGLVADSPEKDSYSQHANIMAVLTNTIPVDLQKTVMDKITVEEDIAACTYYYRFYLTEAIERTKLSDRYPDMLGPWKQMLEMGLTTFAEEPEPTRSDCHAWSASPVYYFLSLVCGIKPNEPGFTSVRIEPSLGRLKWIEGSMPHRMGEIKVSLRKDNRENITGTVVLPGSLTGTFIWQDHTVKLNPGENTIQLNFK